VVIAAARVNVEDKTGVDVGMSNRQLALLTSERQLAAVVLLRRHLHAVWLSRHEFRKPRQAEGVYVSIFEIQYKKFAGPYRLASDKSGKCQRNIIVYC
jgi:hypothetical protein